MYVSPNHPNPPRQAAPPDDDGRRLAAIPRGDGREELRVTLKTFNERPYLAVRLWAKGGNGWWPQKGKGVSIRMGEIGAVIDALQAAVRGGGGHQRQPDREHLADGDRPKFVDKGRKQRPPFDASTGPKQTGGGTFDECR